MKKTISSILLLLVATYLGSCSKDKTDPKDKKQESVKQQQVPASIKPKPTPKQVPSTIPKAKVEAPEKPSLFNQIYDLFASPSTGEVLKKAISTHKRWRELNFQFCSKEVKTKTLSEENFQKLSGIPFDNDSLDIYKKANEYLPVERFESHFLLKQLMIQIATTSSVLPAYIKTSKVMS